MLLESGGFKEWVAQTPCVCGGYKNTPKKGPDE